MSELTKRLNLRYTRARGFPFDSDVVKLCDEHERLEGLLRTWGTEAPDAETYHRREEAVYAEAVRLAGEKT